MWDRTALGTVSVLLNRLLGGRPGESLCFAAASRLGKGATFRFVLPIAKDGRPAPESSGNGREAATEART